MPPKDDALERLDKKLGDSASSTEINRTKLYPKSTGAPNAWDPTPGKSVAARVSKMKPLELLFIGSIVFFLAALLIATLLFFAGNNTVSSKNVDIRITGPSEIGAGSTLSLQVVVTNRNAVPMELTDLVVEFPDGTRSALDVSLELPRTRESLGTIESGKTVNRTVRAVLFGLQGEDFPVKATVEYRVPSSNAVFVAEATHTIRLNESPAAISVDALTETVSGQKATFTVTVRSNSPELLKDMLLLASYPPGFVFDSSSPAPLGRSAWALGDIEPGGERKVTITGTFTGEEGESRVMHLSAGNRKEDDEDTIAAPLAVADLSLTVTKPFISVELALKGSTASTHVISRGEEVTGTIRWINNLPVRVQNVNVTLTLNGQILDRFKVRASQGFYNSNTSSITWDRSTDPDLVDVAPGESGVQEFTIAALPQSAGEFKNPEILLSVSVNGSRLSEMNVPEAVQASASAKAVVATTLELGRSVGFVGGALPLKAGSESTLLITWQVSNSGNAVADAKVTATLPLYVTFKEGAEGIAYTATDRTVTWTVGDIEAGGSRSRSFQVSVVPSVSQVGASPNLVTGHSIRALDRFARTDITRMANDLSTRDIPGGGDGRIAP